VALRCCIDPPCLDPTPWLALSLPAQLRAEGISCTLQIDAISERGVEGHLTADLSPFSQATLQLPGLPDALHASCLAQRGRRVALTWETLGWDSHNGLIRFLYCTPGIWPQRQAPPEWKALIVLFSQLLRAPREARPFRRSLVPKSINSTQSLAPLASHP
jgi:cellulose synthase (UDP-forming)